MPTPLEIRDSFTDICNDQGIKLTQAQRQDINAALANRHYGFVLEDNLVAVTDMLKDPGAHETVNLEYAPTALHGLAVLLSQSEKSYAAKRYTPNADEWSEHIDNARAGRIVTLPKREHWSSEEFGRRQTYRADQMLDCAPSEVQQLLAVINYRAFRSQTMAGPRLTLMTDPQIAAATHELESMPHLTVTNWALAQTVQHAYRYMSGRNGGNMYVIDLCSGSGSTLAPMVSKLGEAQDEGFGLKKGGLGIVGVETTPYLYDDLTGEFVIVSNERLTELGVDKIQKVRNGAGRAALQAGSVSLVLGDVVRSVKQLDLSEVTDNDLVIVTSNYGLHRISAEHKQLMLQKFSHIKNLAVGIGDLNSNGSNVNRGFFNMTNNGPLNAGNALLPTKLKKQGVKPHVVGVNGFRPRYIDKILRRRLFQEIDNDGFLMIGVRGELAEEALTTSQAS